MRKLALIAVLAALAVPLAAWAAPPVKHYPQPGVLGFYRGQTVEYLDFGPVKLARGNKVAPIWAVTNGTSDQVNIIDTVPGQKSYTPLWDVRLVTWKNGVTPRVLKSATAVRAAAARGDVTVKAAGLVVNCPVI
jgi:hypothetical protein